MKEKFNQKCENCGGTFKFDPKTTSIKRASCGNILPIEVKPAVNNDYLEAEVRENSNEWANFVHSYECKSCGAVQIHDKGDIADVCPFCGSANIIDFNGDALLAPNAILPFSISEEDAKNAIIGKIKKSFWVPRDLLAQLTLRNVNGIYTPTYTFDFAVIGTYEGRIGREVSRNIIMRDGTRKTISEIKWQNISGNVNQFFDDVIVDAGQIVTGTTLKQLEPYETNSAIEFNKNFLLGYVANQTSKKIGTAKAQAEEIALAEIKERVLEQNFADKVEYLNFNVMLNNITYKYTLLPVYASSFKYGKKEYKVYVNGTTSKVVGKLPKSKFKIWFFTIFGLFLVAGLIILISL